MHRFTCQPGCAKCCEQKGHVNLSPDDVERIAAFLGRTRAEFETEYVERRPYLRRLRTPKNGGCPFLKDKACSIHPVKPAQCRLFPLWPNIADSQEGWNRTAEWCPGIGQGPLIQIETVEAALAEMRAAYPGFYD